MPSSYTHRTLAKTLSYILYHAPGEHGLFWDPTGTMPWKEFYWVLMEDPSLRFVRQSHIQELNSVQMELPVRLQGNLLCLKDGFPVPDYPVSDHPPGRLFHACPRRQFDAALKHGLKASGRLFLAVAADQDLALKIARRRGPQPLCIEIRAAEASAAGITFRSAGSGLYLVESLPTDYLLFPLVRQEQRTRVAAKKPAKASGKADGIPAPGSFLVGVDHFQQAMAGAAKGPEDEGKKGKKGRKEPDWKRAARKGKDRWKRTV